MPGSPSLLEGGYLSPWPIGSLWEGAFLLGGSDNRSPCGVRYFTARRRVGETEGQRLSVEHSRSSRFGQGKPMTHRENEKGQSLLEYAMVAAVVAAAVIAMSTYVFRSVQATQQTIQTEFQKE